MQYAPRSRIFWFGISLISCLSMLLLLAIAPVPSPQQTNTQPVAGEVVSVSSPCCGDVQIRLKDDPRTYYINRGLEKGLEVKPLRQRLEGSFVQLRMIERSWSPLDPLHRKAPVAHLEHNGELLYAAF